MSAIFQYDNEPRFPFKWSNVIAGLALCVSIFSGWFSCNQTDIMKATLEATKKQADAAAESNRSAWEALKFQREQAKGSDSVTKLSIALSDSSLLETRRSNNIIEKNFKIDSRAYVSIIGFTTLIDAEDSTVIMGFDVLITNLGKTPANKVNIVSSWKFMHVSEKTTMPKLAPDALSQVYFPNQPQPNSHPILITPIDRNSLVGMANMGYFITTFTQITYSDVFGISHYTTSIGKYEPVEGAVIMYEHKAN